VKTPDHVFEKGTIYDRRYQDTYHAGRIHSMGVMIPAMTGR